MGGKAGNRGDKIRTGALSRRDGTQASQGKHFFPLRPRYLWAKVRRSLLWAPPVGTASMWYMQAKY